MRKSLIILSLLSLCSPSFGLETDQFIAGNIHLKDSSDVMNDYFIGHQKKALNWANEKNLGEKACTQVAIKSMALAVGKFDLSAASTYASALPLIERYPNDGVSEREYIN